MNVDEVFGGCAAGGEDERGASESVAAPRRKRLPDLDTVRADDTFHFWGEQAHGTDDRGEIGMRGEDEFRAAAGGAHGAGYEFQFSAVRAGEDEFAVTDPHAMEFLGVIEA